VVLRRIEKQFAIRQQIGNLRLYDGVHLSLLDIDKILRGLVLLLFTANIILTL
jgi:hypothetical protein